MSHVEFEKSFTAMGHYSGKIGIPLYLFIVRGNPWGIPGNPMKSKEYALCIGTERNSYNSYLAINT